MRVIRTFRGDQRRRGTEAGGHIFVARVMIDRMGSVKKETTTFIYIYAEKGIKLNFH